MPINIRPQADTISIALRAEAGRTTVRVRNSGKGIKPEDIGNVFNRFEILDNFERQANEGKVMRNGIGLALAKSLGRHAVGKYHGEQQPRRIYHLHPVVARGEPRPGDRTRTEERARLSAARRRGHADGAGPRVACRGGLDPGGGRRKADPRPDRRDTLRRIFRHPGRRRDRRPSRSSNTSAPT